MCYFSFVHVKKVFNRQSLHFKCNENVYEII